MNSIHRLSVIATALVFSVSFARGQEVAPKGSARVGEIPNWPAPPYWSPPERAISVQEREDGVKTEGAVALPTSALPFIGITPCRVVDTRGEGFTGAYGPPALVGNGPARTFNIPAGPCPGIPPYASAYSINVAAILPASDGFMTVFPTGAAQPNSSDLNFLGGEVIGNAIAAPAGTGGAISIFVNVTTHMILDINGYYAAAGVGVGNTFLGLNAGNFTMTGDYNAGFGYNALSNNTTGFSNTALGFAALVSNTTGYNNTATGYGTLSYNTIGGDNTATGRTALNSNTAGNANTATGNIALFHNTTGNANTATGNIALASNTYGSFNTADGTAALFNNITGSGNTAIGSHALENTTGFSNIGIGQDGGLSLTTGSNNICIGNSGVAGESSTIRIGTVGTQTATFIAGIYDADATGGTAVFITPTGKLGTGMVLSSHRFKRDIRDIAEEGDGLMRLRPVAFKYVPQIDPTGLAHYGLIAEEVADVYPELVAYDRDGRPETVRYNLVNALLLNEVQKQHRRVEALDRTTEQQRETVNQQKFEIEELKDRLFKLEARMTVLLSP